MIRTLASYFYSSFPCVLVNVLDHGTLLLYSMVSSPHHVRSVQSSSSMYSSGPLICKYQDSFSQTSLQFSPGVPHAPLSAWDHGTLHLLALLFPPHHTSPVQCSSSLSCSESSGPWHLVIIGTPLSTAPVQSGLVVLYTVLNLWDHDT